MRRLGTSGDWSRSVFTMDPMAVAGGDRGLRAAARGGPDLPRPAPGQLGSGAEDRDLRPRSRSTRRKTAFLWSIALSARADGSGSNCVVATTRPETMLGDVAVMVHPDDERYAHLIGKTVQAAAEPTARFRSSPTTMSIASSAPAWSRSRPRTTSTTTQVGQRHGSAADQHLHARRAITRTNCARTYRQPRIGAEPAATSAINSSRRLRGLDRYAASRVADRRSLAVLVETKPHKLQVPRGDRTGQVIEPYLTDQWFVKMDGAGRARTRAGRDDGDVKFVPPNWINTYRHWMENIQDWCISRQLWWGHRIPAWYDDAGNIYVGRNEDEVRAQAMRSASDAVKPALRQDNDVLETWFSSQLWPFSTMGWPDAAAMRERGFDRYVPIARAGHRLRHHLLLGRAHDHDDRPLDRAACRSRTSTSPAWSATRTARRCRSRRATSSTRSTSSTASRSTTWSPSAPPG